MTSLSMSRRLIPWILSAVITTLVCGLIGVVVQQLHRQGANDPQIQIAKEMSDAFLNNQFTEETLKSSFETFVPSKIQVHLETSLSPWIQIYDASGENMHSSAVTSDAQSVPHVSKGVFASVDKHGERRITWQPKKGIRQAIVVTKFSGLRNGYIIVGRSLAEAENRIGSMWMFIGIEWFVMMVLIGCATLWNFGYFTKFTEGQKIPRA
jgi:hypothetical protein